MRLAIILALAGVCAVNTGNAQQPTVRKITVAPAATVNLSEVKDPYNADVFNMEAPRPDGNADKKKLREAKLESKKRFPRKQLKAQLKTTVAPSPTVAISYVSDSMPGIPPDNDMAISMQNESVAVMNSNIAVHDALTGQITYRRTLKQITGGMGLGGMENHRYDPKIIYDPTEDRFILVMLNSTDDLNWIIIGFSTSNDPGGSWNMYKLYGNYGNDSTWFDYPSIAITQNEFFLTGNKIKFSASWQAGFRQTIVYQIKKKDGYNNQPITTHIWENVAHNGRNLRNLYPVKGGASIKGPEQYFLSNRNFDVQNDTIFLVKIPDTIGSGNLNMTVTPLISNTSYGVPPDGIQPDPSVVLATNDGRVLGAFIEGNEIQFVSTSVHPLSGSAAVYHGKISNATTNPVVEANYFGIDTLDFGYPNLTFAGPHNGNNTSIISFNYTGANKYPGMGAIYYDGTQFSNMVDIKTGDSSISQLQDTVQRWGDYMGSQADWNALGSVWVNGIFGRKDKDYGNYMAKLVSPNPNTVATVPTGQETAALYPNPAFQYIRLDFELDREEDLTFVIFDIQGRRVDQILEKRCKKGSNKIQFNIASLSHGVYFLKAHNPAGRDVMTKRFIKE